MKELKRTTIVLAAGAVMALAIAGPVSAHVTANPNEGPADGFFKTDFRVGHGCEDSPTTSVSVEIPGNVTSVAPQEVAGWEIETRMGELDEPIESEGGETITEGVREVTWTATDEPLDAHHLQEFGLSMRLPAEEAGTALWFPVVQKCAEGANNWVEIPESVEAWGEMEAPAAYVVLAGSEEEGETGGDTEETAAGDTGMDEAAVREIAADEASAGDSAMTWGILGVVLGALGLILGATAMARARKSA